MHHPARAVIQKDLDPAHLVLSVHGQNWAFRKGLMQEAIHIRVVTTHPRATKLREVHTFPVMPDK